jgi:hypothetical protein
VLRKDIGHGIHEAISLISHQRRHGDRRFREVIEAKLRRAPIDWRGGNSGDTQRRSHIGRKCEIVESLDAVTRKNQLGIVDPAPRQVLRKADGSRLPARGDIALKIRKRLESVIGRLAEAVN